MLRNRLKTDGRTMRTGLCRGTTGPTGQRWRAGAIVLHTRSRETALEPTRYVARVGRVRRYIRMPVDTEN